MDSHSQQVKIEELEKRINSLSKKIEKNQDEIAEQIGALSSNPVYSTGDSFKLKNKICYPGEIMSPRIYIASDPNVPISINIKAKIFFDNKLENLTNTLSINFNATNSLVNKIYDLNYTEEDKEIGYYEKDIDYSFTIMSENGANYFTMYLYPGTYVFSEGHAGILNFSATATGRNVQIITKNNELRVISTHYSYYITKAYEGKILYKRTSASYTNFDDDLSSIPLDLTNSVEKTGELYTNFVYIPTFYANANSNSITENLDKTSFAYNRRIYVDEGTVDSDFTRLSSFLSGTTGVVTFSIGHPLLANSISAQNHGYVGENNLLYCLTGTGSTKKQVKMLYNDNIPPERYADNVTVYAKSAFYRLGYYPQCFVATTISGDNYFYPAPMSTYRVYLGKGHQVQAVMNYNSSINVYMLWYGIAYKKTLNYDSETDTYSLSDEVIELGPCRGYIPGFYNDCFYKKVDGFWYHLRDGTKFS